MTQLGLILPCEPDRRTFTSRAGPRAAIVINLTDLTAQWLLRTFGTSGTAYVAPKPVTTDATQPSAWA